MARTTAAAAIAVALLLVACAPLHASATITHSWTDCGGSVKVSNITMSPPNPGLGEKITITTRGTNSMAADTLDMTLTFAVIFAHNFDGCTGATIEAPFNLAKVVFPPVHCPLRVGQFESVRYVTLSDNLPKGHTTSKLTGHDSQGRQVVCVDLTLANE